jgi:malonyl-CoA O-methyltransferase
MNEQALPTDKGAIRESFGRAAAAYDRSAVLQREVGDRLLGRLDLVRLEPRRVLDLGAGTGAATEQLLKRYPKAEVYALDLAPAMLQHARRRGSWRRRPRCLAADAEALPFREGSFDLIFSNLALQWCVDLPRLFQGLLRVLRPEGLLMFSSFGPDTLKELRDSWAAVDGHSHVNRFVDMHDLGDALVHARFADPVMDMEQITVTYPRVEGLMRDLKNIGAHNVTAGRPRGLTGKGRFKVMAEAYERYRDGEGRLPATYEVVYGHAWAPHTRPQRADASGAVHVPLTTIKRRG